MIKTALENEQNLIVEGCYIPPDYRNDFPADYLPHIRYICLILSEEYIRTSYGEIKEHARDIEKRVSYAAPSKEALLTENLNNLALCEKYGLNYILIDGEYEIIRNYEI